MTLKFMGFLDPGANHGCPWVGLLFGQPFTKQSFPSTLPFGQICSLIQVPWFLLDLDHILNYPEMVATRYWLLSILSPLCVGSEVLPDTCVSSLSCLDHRVCRPRGLVRNLSDEGPSIKRLEESLFFLLHQANPLSSQLVF